MRISNPDYLTLPVTKSPFALDHLSAIETTPLELAETAARAGYARLCTFVRSIEGLGGPTFDLSRAPGDRLAVRAALDALELTVDVAYPFTLSDRTQPGDFDADLDCAAELGARFVNMLIFSRDQERIPDQTARFHELARRRDLEVAIEMVPASAIKSLDQAHSLLETLGRPTGLGVNLDILHLYRSGSTPEAALAHREDVTYLQLCDGPLDMAIEARRHEASLQRRLPGEGDFAISAFLAAFPDVPASLEIPDEAGLRAGQSAVQRAARANAAALQIMR